MIRSPLRSFCPLLPYLLAIGPALAQGQTSKAYDLRFLLVAESPWATPDLLTPDESPDLPRTGYRQDEPVAALQSDELLRLLESALGNTENGAAAPLLTLAGGVLLATGSEAVHDRLATWIELCQSVFLEQVSFEVHLLPATVLAGNKGRVPRDEVDSLLRAAGPHPSFSCSARVGAGILLRSDAATGYVRDYDVEVAQKSTINDPKIDAVLSGRTWAITTGRCADGRLLVSVRGQQSELVGPPRVLDLHHRDLRGKKQLSPIQLPVVRYRSVDAAARLADGEAMLFGGEEEGSACCVRLRRPHAIPAPSGTNWTWLAADDLTMPHPGQRAAHLRLIVPGDDAPLLAEPEEAGPVLEITELMHRLRQVPGVTEEDQVVALPARLMRVQGDAPVRNAASELVRAMATALVQDVTIEVRCGRLSASDAGLAVEGRLDAGELAGRMPGTFMTAAMLDRAFGHVAVQQHSYVRDYEVEIAQESAVPNPVIGVINAGLAISGRVLAASRDRYRLHLDVSFAEIAGDLHLFDLKDEDLGPVELARLRTVTFEVSPVVEARRWTLLYVAPISGADEHYAVLARVRD